MIMLKLWPCCIVILQADELVKVTDLTVWEQWWQLKIKRTLDDCA